MGKALACLPAAGGMEAGERNDGLARPKRPWLVRAAVLTVLVAALVAALAVSLGHGRSSRHPTDAGSTSMVGTWGVNALTAWRQIFNRHADQCLHPIIPILIRLAGRPPYHQQRQSGRGAGPSPQRPRSKG